MTWYSELPKIELHVHLEGAIPHDALFDLIQKYGGDPSIPNVSALASRFEYKNFTQFVEAWSWKNQFLRVYEDFTHIAEHPIRKYFDLGLIISVNTDDPAMFGTALNKEYELLVEECGFTTHEICRLILLGVESSWLPEKQKKILALNFEKDPSWVGSGLF